MTGAGIGDYFKIAGLCLLAALFYAADKANKGHIDLSSKTRTKALIADVVNAVKTYKLEYNRLPVDPEWDESRGTIDFDKGDGARIFAILMGENLAWGDLSKANPREIVFIEPDTSSGFSLGVVFEGDSPARLLDAWGQVIHIRMDMNHDRRIADPDDSAEDFYIRKEVIVWSDGRPGDEDSAAPWINNVKSWE